MLLRIITLPNHELARHRWERNAGLCLDHLLLSPNIASRLKAVGVDREVRGKPGAKAPYG